MEEDDVILRQKTVKHLTRLSMVVSGHNIPLSNYFRFDAAFLNNTKTEKLEECPSCGHTYQQPEDKFRLQAKIPMTGKVRKLLRKYMQNKQSLGKCQLHIVDRYLSSTNLVKLSCSICGKSEKFPGQLREKRSAQKKAQRVLPEEVSYVSLKTRKEKRKELKMKNKQRKREKMIDKFNHDTPSSHLEDVSDINLESELGSSHLSTGGTADEKHSTDLTTATSQGISKTTVSPNHDQSFIKSTVTSEIERCQNKEALTSKSTLCQNKDAMTSKNTAQCHKDAVTSKITQGQIRNTVNSRIIQSCIKDKETNTGPVGGKSAKRLKSKNSHQRLSQMLAQQNKGRKGSSLTDFLSTL
ncbi:uncharacterized protein LOC117336772 isoform X1 [Pecten maximus]|uniref:uncharacterized protein LOC117336772 isoform X1 n=1 Tax=Pecten maximus TaxID=6579 RepID=UPI00145805E7|nr:uncharacterized protein LOC117336772 isoform X1 [Pecten maximus]